MALFAVALPILPGKKGKWQDMINTLDKEPMKSTMNRSRAAVGVHERTFLQETPQGDFVIVTLEGANPGEAFGRMMSDPSMKEFAEWAADVHGMDPRQPPPAMPKLIYDSKA